MFQHQCVFGHFFMYMPVLVFYQFSVVIVKFQVFQPCGNILKSIDTFHIKIIVWYKCSLTNNALVLADENAVDVSDVSTITNAAFDTGLTI